MRNHQATEEPSDFQNHSAPPGRLRRPFFPGGEGLTRDNTTALAAKKAISTAMPAF